MVRRARSLILAHSNSILRRDDLELRTSLQRQAGSRLSCMLGDKAKIFRFRNAGSSASFTCLITIFKIIYGYLCDKKITSSLSGGIFLLFLQSYAMCFIPQGAWPWAGIWSRREYFAIARLLPWTYISHACHWRGNSCRSSPSSTTQKILFLPNCRAWMNWCGNETMFVCKSESRSANKQTNDLSALDRVTWEATEGLALFAGEQRHT